MMGSSMFQGVPMHQICCTRVGWMGGRQMETSGCCVLVVGHGIKNLGRGHVLPCSHTEHTLVYACITQEQWHRVCRRDVETIGGVCLGQKQSKPRGKMACCLLCVCILSLSFSFSTTRFAP